MGIAVQKPDPGWWDILRSGMFATLKLLFVYLTLGVPAGVIGIPYSLLVGNVDRLYRIAMWIANAGVRAAGIRIEVTGLSDSAVIVEYRTCDGTATARQGNFEVSSDTMIFRSRQTASSSPFIVWIGRLTAEQRTAGGATFKIKLGTVVGAVAEVKEKTITILPAEK